MNAMNRVLTFLLMMGALSGCGQSSSTDDESAGRFGADWQGCRWVPDGFGSQGELPLVAETVVEGLEIPWAIGFISSEEWLVSERSGRVRLIQSGSLVPESVLELPVGEQGEGGLMGLALHPNYPSRPYFYVYYTAAGDAMNRLERYRLSADMRSASLDRVLFNDVPAGTFHNGGRIRFGPDGMLYVGTGDARQPDFAQDPDSPAGKLLRVDPESGARSIHLSGIRNTQGFDWLEGDTLIVSDHGPSGELGLTGRDEITIASRGDNLGWPRISACESAPGLRTPFIAWNDALPPGGLLVYRGDRLPMLRGDVLITALGSTHLQRLTKDGVSERYFSGQFGRLREIVQSPDGSILMTTSNCDGRGSCGAEKDQILRLRIAD